MAMVVVVAVMAVVAAVAAAGATANPSQFNKEFYLEGERLRIRNSFGSFLIKQRILLERRQRPPKGNSFRILLNLRRNSIRGGRPGTPEVRNLDHCFL